MFNKLLCYAGVFSLLASASVAQVHNYSEAFQKSLFFYEIQHSGHVPLDHRVEWRGPAAIRDGADVGRDLTGGWYDAGDGVVWTGNDSFGASILAWSLVKYRDVYIQTGQYRIAIDRLLEISDYLTKIVELDANGNITRIYCGKGSIAHKPPNDPAIVNDRTVGQPNELLDTLIAGAPQSIRPSYWVDSVTGGSDVAGAVSSALASASIAFRDFGDATRADQLLSLSKKVFAWGDTNRNLALSVDGIATSTATRRITNGSPVTLPDYPARVRSYIPRMIYASAWLHRADLSAATAGYTNAWVNKAESLYNETANTNKLKHWETFAPGGESNGAYAMLAADSGRAVFVTEANNYANFWLYDRSNNTGRTTDPTVTPAGFISRGFGAGWNVHTFVDQAPPLLDWADSPFNTNTTQKANLIALYTGTYGPPCPIKQIDYILGSNPLKLSYLAGYIPTGTGYDWPRNLHHRALGADYGGFGTPPAEKNRWNTFIPYGMVVPGPNNTDFYPQSKPLTEGTTLGHQEPIIYSGGILTVLARNIRAGGANAGAPLSTFPTWETRPADYQTKFFFVQARAVSSTSVDFELNNRSIFPPRENNTLGFRYYFVPDGTTGSNVTCTVSGQWLLSGETASVSPAVQVGNTGTWYFAVTLNNAMIVPSEFNRFRRTVRLNFAQTGGGVFSLANDPSGSAITATQAPVANIPVYDTSFTPWKILGGFEPAGSGYIQWRRAHFNNVMENAGSVVLIAERIGGSTGAVSATVSLTDGTATAPADYGIPANTTLSWSNGEMGEKTFSVPIVDNLIDEGREFFTATLTSLSGGAVAGITTSARVSIEDNDYGSTASVPAAGTLLSYEGFGYTASASITGQTGGTGWRSPINPSWASGGTSGTVAASGLSYTAIDSAYTAFAPSGLAGNFSGGVQNNRLPAIDTGGVYDTAGLKATDGNYLGGSTVTGTLWGSVLVAANPWATASGPQMLFNLGSTTGTGTGTQASIRQTAAGSAISVTDGSGGGIEATGSIPTTSLSTTTPNLIVFRYMFNGAGNDTFAVWLNPVSATDTPAITATAADFVFNNLTLRSVNANGGLIYDEIRIGTSFAVVTPYAQPPTALATFRTANGLAPDGSQDTLTPAGDGVQNLLKYAFNMLGSGTGQAASLNTPNASVLTSDGSAGLPLVGVESSTAKLQLTYIRRIASASPAPGITYAVEFSDALVSWAVNGSASVSVTDLGPTFERVTVTDSVSTPTKRFVRVRVTTM